MQGYKNYKIVKGWRDDKFFLPTTDSQRIFRELSCIKAQNVYELGFGNGALINLFSASNCKVFGKELDESLNLLARENGVEIASLVELKDGSVDLVLAIDVLEHLTLPEISDFMCTTAKKLKVGGSLYLRFPNGDSLLSNYIQYGDPTHITRIGAGMLLSLAFDARLHIARMGREPVRVKSYRDLPRFIIDAVASDLISFAIRLFARPNCPTHFWSRNYTVLLKRTS